VPLSRDADADLGWSDHLAYHLENLISAEPFSRFYILIAASSALCVAFALGWSLFVTPMEDVFDFWSALFMAMQVHVRPRADPRRRPHAPNM
jgi:hypothetical protein